MDHTGVDRSLRRHASWNGRTLAFSGVQQPDAGAVPYLMLADVEASDGVPILDPDQHSIPVSLLMWPAEQLISRHIMLPLAHPRLLDAEIVVQELCEQAGDAASDYWLAWHAGKAAAGVEGIVFGLPSEIKQTMEKQDAWRQCEAIVPDAWVRLSVWPVSDGGTGIAVIDEDREGFFVGLRGPAGWMGMRRINRAPWKADDDLAEDILRTLTAMGWETEEGMATGRLSTAFLRCMSGRLLQWQGREEDDGGLPDRHQANLEAAAHLPQVELNFRHGSWRKRSDPSVSMRRWRHTFVLLGMLCVVSIVGGIWRLMSLERQADTYRSAIVAAFHRGLPGEKVMLEPLGQLRMAAQGSTGDTANDDFLRRLTAVARARKAVPGWSIREIDYGDGAMRLFGVAGDFAMVNRIRDALAAGGGRNVRIEDTEAQDKQVGFRMRW